MEPPTKSANLERSTEKRRSYLLRLWRSDLGADCCWHASLEDPHTAERIGFADLEHLFAYLMELEENSI